MLILLSQLTAVKIKEGKKIDKYLDLARELNMLCNMRVIVIPVVVDALGTVPKGLESRLEELEIRRRIKIIQATVLLRIVRIMRKVLETWEDLLSIRFQWKTFSYCWWDKCTGSKIIIIIVIDKRRNSTNGPENKKTQDDAKDLTSQRLYRQTICVKKRRGRGFTNIENSINTSIRHLKDYIKKANKDSLQWPETALTTQSSTEHQ